MLTGKRVLLFAPDFFEYYKLIESELIKRHAEVFTILEDYSNRSPLYRMFFVKNRWTKYYYTNSKLRKAIGTIEKKIDFVFVVRGEAISPEIINILKHKYPEACFLMYQWDSILNNPNSLEIAKYFNRVYTFDRMDAELMGWIYRPLFYVNESKTNYNDRKYDLSFIGTLYYRRAELFAKLKHISCKNNWSFFSHIFSLKYVFYIHKYFMRDSRYSSLGLQDVRFFALSKDVIDTIYSNSKVVVDYSAENQNGLTIRTIESVANNCKLMTNNKLIMKEPFYRKENIYVYDLNNFDIPKDFIETEYKEIENDIIKYYSLAEWINTIFEV